MRAQYLKLAILALVIIAGIAFVTMLQPATAAPPDTPVVIDQTAPQASEVTFKKEASKDSVPLGEVVSYTITIKNSGAETLNASLIDPMPNGLVIQKPISATVGTAETNVEDNVVTWSGSLAKGEEAKIYYGAIPPSTSNAGQTLSNMATLEFGGDSLQAEATITTTEPDLGIWGGFVNLLALVLVWMNNILDDAGLVYSFGFAIILFTVIVRLLTFPLNMQQIKSSKAMQELQPLMKDIQTKYKDDREKLAQEQMKLYKEHGVNPLGGCLPMLVQMPIWFALYQSLRQLSREGLLNEGFFWIPSLSGPVSDWGGGIEWLWPFPPAVGWPHAVAYLVLPVLLVVSQLYMQKMMTPTTSDPQQASMQSVMKFMPLMFGYFALVVPSGLTLYWFTSNLLAMAQQYFTKTQVAPTATGAINKPATATAESNSPSASNPGGSTKSQDARKSKRKKRRK